MTKYKYLDPAKYRHLGPEVEAQIRDHNEWREERDRIISTPEFKASEAAFRRRCENNPMIGRVIQMSFYRLLSPSKKRDVEAVGVLIDRLERMLRDEPALQASSGVSEALRDVISSLESVNAFNSDYNGVIDAFALPSKSVTNQANAREPRAKAKDGVTKMKDLAAAHFDEWAANPSLYRSKAAFKRELYDRAYCLDQGTAGTWLDDFLALLAVRDPGHALVKKFIKK